MPPPRAPLFSVSLAFATGCVLGLQAWIPLTWSLPVLALTALLWWRLGSRENASLAAFYLFTAAAGLTHTLLVTTTIAAHDLRRLPDEKTYPTTQWRGIVIAEPVAQISTRTPRRALDRTSFIFEIQSWRPTGGRYFGSAVDTPWQPAEGNIDCTLLGPADNLQIGDQLETALALRSIEPPLVSGAPDYRLYNAEQGVYYQATIAARDWRRLETGGGNFWQNLSFRARDWAYARLQIGLEDDPRIADFLAGMLIGYRQEIPADIEQDFRRTGTLHVFAVSGQNIAELMVVAIIILQLFGFVRWRWAWTLAPLILVYCLLTGSPASALRATVMVLAVLLAWRLGRPLNALGCWSLALLAMLIWNPLILLDPGAQLSFGVVLGLILLGPPIARLLQRPFALDPLLPRESLTSAQKQKEAVGLRLSQILGATIAATLVSEPITMIDFHQVTPVSVLANLIVVPMAGLITVVGTLSLTCSLFTTTWAALLNNANWLFARLLIAFVGYLAHKPGASLNVPDLCTLNSPLPSLVVAPLQDSACLLLRTKSQTWLFNTGREVPARNATSRLLQYYGVNHLDGLVLLQIDTADNSGAALIVRDFQPRHLIAPPLRSRSPTEKILPSLAALAGHPLEFWQPNQTIQLDSGVSIEVLNPPSTNTRSLILLFHAAGQTLLWAGRSSPALQQQILSTHPNLHADLLVLDPQTTPTVEWLRALHVNQWLQFPLPDHRLNTATPTSDWPSACGLWPLNQTGAVEINFLARTTSHPAQILLRPWVALPSAPTP